MRWLSWLFLAGVMLTGCAGQSAAAPAASAPSSTQTSPTEQLFVLPDDGLEPLLTFIRQAQRTLDVYIFQLDNPTIELELVRSAGRGVKVRAVMEPEPTGRSNEAHRGR